MREAVDYSSQASDWMESIVRCQSIIHGREEMGIPGLMTLLLLREEGVMYINS